MFGVDLTAYKGYVNTFMGTLQTLTNELAERTKDKEEMQTDDEPFDYTSFIYSGSTYKKAVNEYVKLKAEYDKQGRKVSWVLILGIGLGVLLLLFLPKLWLKLFGVIVILATLFFAWKLNKAFNNIEKPETYRDKLMNKVLCGMGGVDSLTYSSAVQKVKGGPKKTLYQLRGNMYSLNDKDYIRSLLMDLGISSGAGLAFNFDSSMTVQFNGEQKGKMVKLTSTHEEQTKDSDGKTSSKTVEDLDGFALFISGDYSGSLTDGERLLITPQGGYLSRIAEDTTRNILGSKKEYVFNLEELNEQLNCKLSTKEREPDAIQEKLQKIMSPDFEDFLSFMLHRYNQFNLVISTDSMELVVNTNDRRNTGIIGTVQGVLKDGVKSLLPKMSKDNLVKDKFDGISTSKSNEYERFQYWSVFPLLDTAYAMRSLSKYVSYIMDTQKIDNSFLQSFDSYKVTMEELANTPFKEFLQTVKEEFGDLKD